MRDRKCSIVADKNTDNIMNYFITSTTKIQDCFDGRSNAMLLLFLKGQLIVYRFRIESINYKKPARYMGIKV